jgi:hypothetical protein
MAEFEINPNILETNVDVVLELQQRRKGRPCLATLRDRRSCAALVLTPRLI